MATLTYKSQRSMLRPAALPLSRGVLQRKCVCGGTPGPTGECDACRRKRTAAARPGGSTVPPAVHETLRTAGQPLDTSTRSLLEHRFGYDFSGVRVHTGPKAAESAGSVNAQAYTVGEHIVFGAGRYAPSQSQGLRLLAHELTHVVQQRASATSPLSLGDPASPAEREAEQVASSAGGLIGQTVQPSVQRQPVPDEPRPRNEGPPLQEAPLPPRCSIIWKDGRWSWKCEGIPKIGSTPEIPLDPRDIPDRIRDLIPKGPDGAPGSGERTFPFPSPPGSDLPPNWLETICQRSPMSPLCIPLGEKPRPDQPSPGETLTKPIGVFWTTNVLFEQDQPATATGAPNGGITADGTSALDLIIFLLKSDPTLRVRLVGHASAEGTPAHNLELSKRRVRLVYQKLEAAGLGGQVIDPLESDGKTDGCTRLEIGVWACGEAQATQGEALPEERRVAATFLRNPPLPSGPFRLTLPEFGRR
jgi:hypothetical protein